MPVRSLRFCAGWCPTVRADLSGLILRMGCGRNPPECRNRPFSCAPRKPRVNSKSIRRRPGDLFGDRLAHLVTRRMPSLGSVSWTDFEHWRAEVMAKIAQITAFGDRLPFSSFRLEVELQLVQLCRRNQKVSLLPFSVRPAQLHNLEVRRDLLQLRSKSGERERGWQARTKFCGAFLHLGALSRRSLVSSQRGWSALVAPRSFRRSARNAYRLCSNV